jgi:hypothetical protein
MISCEHSLNIKYTRVILAGVCCILLGGEIFSKQNDQLSVDIQTLFTASGWMGDGEYGQKYIHFSGSDTTAPHSPPSSIKVIYTFGPSRWAGVYWQNEPDNWGEKPGANYSGKQKLTFWARGLTGKEVVEFKAGGINNSTKNYRDSFGLTIGRQNLTKEWKQYEINLSTANLNSVIGAFCWVASADYNPGKQMTFFLDDIILQ